MIIVDTWSCPRGGYLIERSSLALPWTIFNQVPSLDGGLLDLLLGLLLIGRETLLGFACDQSFLFSTKAADQATGIFLGFTGPCVVSSFVFFPQVILDLGAGVFMGIACSYGSLPLTTTCSWAVFSLTLACP